MSCCSYTDQLEALIDLDTDYGLLEGVPATAEISFERYPAEPFSWGQSRGYETSISATIRSARLGRLVLTRDQIALMIGADVLDAIEESIAEGILMEEAA